MTNTHINFGGHKITTNKVGQVHNISASMQSVTGGNCAYCVQNGICYVEVWGITTLTVGQSQAFLATGVLPKPKMRVLGALNTGASQLFPAIIFCDTPSGGAFFISIFVANAMCFGSFAYPVADDWVES